MGQMKLYWESDVWTDYRIYCAEAHPDEIAGMGTIEERGGKLVVTKLFLVKQEVSPGSADFDDEAYGEFFEKYCEEGGKPEELRLWWHTHPSMSVDFSAKDRNTIDKVRKGSKWFVAVVINEKGDRQGEWISGEFPFLSPIKLSKDDFVNVFPTKRIEELKAEIKAKVSKHSYTYVQGKNGRYSTPTTRAALPYTQYGHGYGNEDWNWDDWHNGKVTAGAKPGFGGYNGLGSKGTNDAKGDTRPIQVPSVLGKPSTPVAEEKLAGSTMPPANELVQSVANDIVANVIALARKGK